ncbi:hypothetical protein OB919_16985, partial [Halobacteria archaeon AArc-curdl1]|nr:hypothetical protein [Halobacteria archaeon AArc-curdl1]
THLLRCAWGCRQQRAAARQPDARQKLDQKPSSLPMVVRRPARSRRSLAVIVPGKPAFPRVTGFVEHDEHRFPARPFVYSSEYLPLEPSVLETSPTPSFITTKSRSGTCNK